MASRTLAHISSRDIVFTFFPVSLDDCPFGTDSPPLISDSYPESILGGKGGFLRPEKDKSHGSEVKFIILLTNLRYQS